MQRVASVILIAQPGHGASRQFPLRTVENYHIEQAMDNDTDSFSLDIGDPFGELEYLTERDIEVRANIFLSDPKMNMIQVFSGVADTVQADSSDSTVSLQGRDLPSALAADSDASVGQWYHVNPKSFITARAHNLGIQNVAIATMSGIKHLWQDASETEWQFWYRIARSRGMYMWSDNVGKLLVNQLGYSLAPTYKFGVPLNPQETGWVNIERAVVIKNTQGRKRRILIYGEDAKKGKAFVAQAVDVKIASWKKAPLLISTSTTAKKYGEAKKEADLEMFETIVGAREVELTIHDTGIIVQQNRMASLRIPEFEGLAGTWFIVGVTRQAGPDGMVQVVRLREKGFALDKRIPTAPIISKPPNAAADEAPASIAGSLASQGIRWSDSFVRATKEFASPPWDFAVFCGVLMAICAKETGFHDEREIAAGAFGNRDEWMAFEKWINNATNSQTSLSISELQYNYQRTFANNQEDPLNPFHTQGRRAGVGPMQLTTFEFVQWADNYGWSGVANSDEFQGGRWNPDSNIRAAARALMQKLAANPPADPNNSDTIWLGVARYNGSQAYADDVKANYFPTYYAAAQAAVATAGSALTSGAQTNIDGHGTINFPPMPEEATKAIDWIMNRLGDAYEWAGAGPLYDCSSLVTAALGQASSRLHTILDVPNQATDHHGETTYTLWTKGRFPSVDKSALLPGDLVFFRGDPPEHVGMYLSDGLFIQDPAPGGYVKVSGLSDEYYASRYSGARRIISWPTRIA